MTESTTLDVVDREQQVSTVTWEPHQSLMEALRDNDFPVLASCGGTASCATCHVFLEPAFVEELGERSEDEQELLDDVEDYDPARSRLACQVSHDSSRDGLTVVIAPEDD